MRMNYSFKLKKRSILLIFFVILFNLIIKLELSYSESNITANFLGRTIFSVPQINKDGLYMEIRLSGASFRKEISDEMKEELVSKIFIDLDDGHIFDGKTDNLERLKFIKEYRKDVLVKVGVDSEGNEIDSIDRFLNFKKEIPDEIKKNGNIYINREGNLVIECKSDYFRNISNNIIYTNGGVPVAWGDIPIYINIPKDMIEEGKEDIRVEGFYCIVEMKARVEILEYEDESAIENRDISRTKHVDFITEQDIRNGGKLLKINVDSRNGPTNWAVKQKRDPIFIKNTFRTEKNQFENLEDNIEWKKIETELGAEFSPGQEELKDWNGYWLSDIKSTRNEKTIEEMSPMYFILEIPKIKDFNIDEDLTVYISLLAGMGGGTGKSGDYTGEPFWGHDGRLSFVILSGEDSDIIEQRKDNSGNDMGFQAGSGVGFGNEPGKGDGSDSENIEQKNNENSKIKETKDKMQSIEINEAKKEEELQTFENKQNQTNNIAENKSENGEDFKEKKQLEQGSAGEGKKEKVNPRKVYDISDQILEDTKVNYEFNLIFIYLIVIILFIFTGAVFRYFKISKNFGGKLVRIDERM